jgi:3-oxoacyl-[acyl-carrier-protein] synthase-3
MGMTWTLDDWMAHLLNRLRQVQRNLGLDPAAPADANARFADLLDSMGMVEFLGLLADDCGLTPEAIETRVGRRFGTVADLARALHGAAATLPSEHEQTPRSAARLPGSDRAAGTAVRLTATAVRLPSTVQSAAWINAALHRPAGWLENHAGIFQRHVWADDDPLTAAADAARECLDQTGVSSDEVGALLVTSEAPPVLTGLAAALHHRLSLSPGTVALEVGGACTGFLAALWAARALLPTAGRVLIIAVEAPSRFLQVEPGPTGEAAALFGDGAAACLVSSESIGGQGVRLMDILLGADGSAGNLLRVERAPSGSVELVMDGTALATRALRTMAQLVRDLARQHELPLAVVQAVVAHGGNGRFFALLARRLEMAPERVWSETARTGNLGSASLPVAWAAHRPGPPGAVLWTAVGAGLTWGAAITISEREGQ